MARDRALRALRASDLEHDHRLSGGGGAVERGDVALGLAHGLSERRDHLGGGIVDEIFEIVDPPGDSLVARRDREAHSVAAQIGQERDADRAALGHDPDIAGKFRRIHHGLLVGGRARRRIEDAHAVRPAHGHVRLAAQIRDFGLLARPFLAELGEAGVVDDRGAGAAFHRQPHLLRQEQLADAEDHDVGRLRQIGQARVADEIADGLIFGVDRIDRSGKADRAKRLDDGARGTDAIRGSHNCDRTRFDQRIKLHVPHPWAGLCRKNNEIRTPSSTAPVSSVDTTAMTGSDSRRIDSNIFFGKVDASRPAMKIATTASLKECRKANSAPTRIPGRSTGSVTQSKVRSGPAPALMAARSRLRSKPLSAAATTRKATGIDSTLWATIMPVWVPTRCKGPKKL